MLPIHLQQHHKIITLIRHHENTTHQPGEKPHQHQPIPQTGENLTVTDHYNTARFFRWSPSTLASSQNKIQRHSVPADKWELQCAPTVSIFPAVPAHPKDTHQPPENRKNDYNPDQINSPERDMDGRDQHNPEDKERYRQHHQGVNHRFLL